MCPMHSEAKEKCWSLERRKVYCRAIQGRQVTHDPTNPELPQMFQQNIFKSKVRGRGGWLLQMSWYQNPLFLWLPMKVSHHIPANLQ